MRRRQAGATLLELLLSISIAITVLMISVGFYTQAERQNTRRETIRYLKEVQGNVRRAHQDRQYALFSTAEKNQWIPFPLSNDGYYLFPGSVKYALGVASADSWSFSIRTNDIADPAVCADFVLAMAEDSIQVVVGGFPLKATPSSPINTATLTMRCQGLINAAPAARFITFTST